MGNKQVVNRVSLSIANRGVAPSLRAAGGVSDGGVTLYWWKCGNWPSELQEQKSSVQYFTSYLLFFFPSLSLSVTHRFTAIKFCQRVLFHPRRRLKVSYTLSQKPFLLKYIDVGIRGLEGKKPILLCLCSSLLTSIRLILSLLPSTCTSDP